MEPTSEAAPHPLSPTTPVGETTTAKPRTTRGKYISKACFECRKRKSKCNGRSPCLRCARQSLTCAYPASKKQRENPAGATSEGDTQAIRSLKEQVASLQGDLALLRQQQPTHQRLSTQTHSSPQFDDTFSASRSRLISPDYTDPGSNAARPDQAYPSVESAESQENCQPSASYTFNISLARTHLRAQGIAMTDSDKQGSSLSTDPTRPSSPSIQTPLEFGIGSVDPLWLIDEKEAIRLCDLYEAEIGIQYPFLNMSKLIDNVRTLYRAMATGSQNGFAFTAMPGPTVIDPLDLDLIKMVISTGSVVEAGGSSQLGKALFLGVRKASHDKLWESAGIKNTMLFVLLAIYSFMTGDDLQAWRLVGVSARWCLEIGLHQSATVSRLFREEEQQKMALRLFWCVYTLDRRWGFGAGLPFVMHHCDVDRNLPEPDYAVPYLKAMVAYSQIGNKVWSTSYNSARTTGAVRDDEISYLLYLIDRWYEELPDSLRLSQDWESREWTQATRVPQRLQLLLHLRANQMKILLLQPILHSPSSLKANKSKVQSLIRFAKDTIRKLHSLNKSTDIYQTQQMCFNHFLVSALGVIFLVVALAPSEYGSMVRDEFHIALDLIRGLSAKSYVSSRLWKMVGDLRLAWRKLGLNPPQSAEDRETRAQRSLAATPPPSSSNVDHSPENVSQTSDPGLRQTSNETWQPGGREAFSDLQMAQELSDFFNAMDNGPDFTSSYPSLGLCGEDLDGTSGQTGESVADDTIDSSMLDVSHLFVDML